MDNVFRLMAVMEPLHRALKIKKEEVGGASKPSNVAAIDFGTTSVSLAYTTERDDKINTFFIDQIHERVPNAILLEKMNDGTCEVKHLVQGLKILTLRYVIIKIMSTLKE